MPIRRNSRHTRHASSLIRILPARAGLALSAAALALAAAPALAQSAGNGPRAPRPVVNLPGPVERLGPNPSDALAIRFTRVPGNLGIDYVHHDGNPPVPPLFERQNTRFGSGAAVIDYDRDGDQDLYIPDSFGHPNMLYRNNGDGTFTNMTRSVPPRARDRYAADTGWGHMALAVDLNNDGWDDLAVSNDASEFTDQFPRSQIFRNNRNGIFTNVTAGSGFAPWDPTIGGMAAGDYDNDGDLDLLIVGWYDYKVFLYRNDGNFKFTDVTVAAGAVVPRWRSHWTPIMADFDNDGDVDIYAAVDFEEDYFLRNRGDGTFFDDSIAARTLHVRNDMGVAVGDFDNDLDLDIYTTNISSEADCPLLGGCNMLYVNNGLGIFSDGTAAARVGNTGWSWGTLFMDAELDGDLDLPVVTGWTQPFWQIPATFYVNDGTGKFTNQAAAVGFDHVGDSRGLTPFDYDNDGDIDLLVFDVMAPLAVYRNDSDRGANTYLYVEAEGRQSNRNGVGAKIYVTAGGRTQFREIIAGGSFYASPPKEAHFGLGPATRVDEIRVVFPRSGKVAVLRDALPNRRIRIVEP